MKRLILVYISLFLVLFLTACARGPAGESIKGDRGEPGVNGEEGLDGRDGIDGVDGSSCSVNQTETGSLITCSDGSTSEVTNGVDGTDGSNGQDGTPYCYKQTKKKLVRIECPGDGV